MSDCAKGDTWMLLCSFRGYWRLWTCSCFFFGNDLCPSPSCASTLTKMHKVGRQANTYDGVRCCLVSKRLDNQSAGTNILKSFYLLTLGTEELHMQLQADTEYIWQCAIHRFPHRYLLHSPSIRWLAVIYIIYTAAKILNSDSKHLSVAIEYAKLFACIDISW